MTDMKLKVENGILENDTHLYNQNGTMVAAKAVSKLVNSHSDSISSNKITRYKRYYNFYDVPQVGQIVDNNGERYIINNVSIDFAENDNNGYALDCQFTLTKQVSCKSSMIEANTNIRDYDTPQKHNIYRVQNYRDYIYLYYGDYVGRESTYMDFNNIFYFPTPFTYGSTKGYKNTHTAIMKIRWAESSINYYQLQSIKYELDKMVVEVIDFKDNNIIGYAVNSTNHPFQISTWWVSTDLIQVPVSYVDSVGHLISIDIKLCSNEQLTSAYEILGQTSIYGASCIIPESLYNLVENNNDAEIVENDYDKDGLEIPMFIYSCQVGNRDGIVFADDFLNTETLNDDEFYVYGYHIIDNLYVDSKNAIKALPIDYRPFIESGNVIVPQLAVISSSLTNVFVRLYEDAVYDLTNGAYTSQTPNARAIYGKTVAIYRFKMKNGSAIPLSSEFVMAFNNCKINDSTDSIQVSIGSRKLK